MRFWNLVLLVAVITLWAGGNTVSADKTNASVATSVDSSALSSATGTYNEESRFLRSGDLTDEENDSIDNVGKKAVALDTEDEEERGLKEVFSKILVELKFFGKELPLTVWWGFRMGRWLGRKVPPKEVYDKLKVYQAPVNSRKYRVYDAYRKLYENQYGPVFNPLRRPSP